MADSNERDLMRDGFTLVDGDAEAFFEDPKEAGAAFYLAESANKPMMVYMHNGSSRFFASTEEEGGDNGESKYVKRLPVAHAPFGVEAKDSETMFLAGFKEALAATVQREIEALGDDEQLPQSVRDDLELLSKLNKDPAAAVQQKAGPKSGGDQAEDVPGESGDEREASPIASIELVGGDDFDRDEILARAAASRKRDDVAPEPKSGAGEYDRDEILARAAQNRMRESYHSEEATDNRPSRKQVADEEPGQGHGRNHIEPVAEKHADANWRDRYDINTTRGKSEYFFKDTTDRAFVHSKKRIDVDTASPQVASDIVALASELGWSKIKVAGEADFRHDVWLAASKLGIAVEGYSPSADKTFAPNVGASKPSPSHESSQTPSKSEKVPAEGAQAKGAGSDKEAEQPSTSDFARAKAANQPDINQKPASPDNQYQGELVDFARAPFQFQEDGQMSFYVKLKGDDGEQTLWGKQLEPALAEIAAKRGDVIELERMGKTPVEVDVPQYNDDGKRTGFRKEKRMRTEWIATPAPAPVDATSQEDSNKYSRSSRPSM